MTLDPEAALEFPEPEAVGARRRRRRYLMSLAAAFLGLLAVVATIYFSPLFPLRTIEVQGNELLTDQQADELLSDLYGQPVAQVGTGEVHERLDAENVVAEVSSRIELPGTLHVEIVEHPPVAEVHQDGDVLLYSDLGEVIRTFAGAEQLEAEDYATPEISSEAALEDEAVFGTIVSVLGELPPDARSQLDSATADSIDSVQLELADGRTVVWGSDDRGEEKAVVLQSILGSSEEAFQEADIIDISTPSTPVTR
ncbi:FtsQ-type POTRA domain-containing protein [Nesterenkonia salmonea]|uniref:FtsQ-type POTRA domain-containing protein n=1 Tax=Nesterenkonia salmonea TaxID=1804987 RepID=A0A5R9BDN5_9MICC|nr:FtsQ-type POTRA domain-containing protein [Nesterenkonia salmonea]TLP98359.1 FtsQ-type POTRA domain-containing protein [Nesterenkonia salmonea]